MRRMKNDYKRIGVRHKLTQPFEVSALPFIARTPNSLARLTLMKLQTHFGCAKANQHAPRAANGRRQNAGQETSVVEINVREHQTDDSERGKDFIFGIA